MPDGHKSLPGARNVPGSPGAGGACGRHGVYDGHRCPSCVRGELDAASATLRRHQMYDRCVRIYHNALIDWNASGAIRSAAATLGMDRRAYCDARIRSNQFQWYSSSTGEELTHAHLEAAWLDALEQSGV